MTGQPPAFAAMSTASALFQEAVVEARRQGHGDPWVMIVAENFLLVAIDAACNGASQGRGGEGMARELLEMAVQNVTERQAGLWAERGGGPRRERG